MTDQPRVEAPAETVPAVSSETLREVVESLAPVDRTPCSPGERDAASWIERRLRTAGCEDVVATDEPSWGPFPPLSTELGVLSALAGALVLRRHRIAGALASLAAIGGLVDEIHNGPRVFRRKLRRRRTTVNVVARISDPEAARTLVVLAHHDAAQTGAIFDQRPARALYERAPELIGGMKTGPPQWWAVVGGPILTLSAAMLGRRRAATAGLVLSLGATGFLADIWRSPTVPGANDNLSGVAGLVALAEMLSARPVPGLRVLLVSCGAEETLQDGIRAFMTRHRDELAPGRTFFINLDTIGSPELVMLEGEGPLRMEDYTEPAFRDLIASCADDNGITLERGVRARASTDGIIPSRAGFPTATLISLAPWRLPTNYHLMTDVPENLDYDTVAAAVRLTYAAARALAKAG
jgi:Zn-dependent M28 family amino/carboxypeptidase